MSDTTLDGPVLSADGTPLKQSLNKALFAGFDSAFDRIYYELGQAAGRVLNSRDI